MQFFLTKVFFSKYEKTVNLFAVPDTFQFEVVIACNIQKVALTGLFIFFYIYESGK